MNNHEIPPKAFVGGAHELCAICGLPETGDSRRVEWHHPHRVLCITCLTAANAAMENVEAVVIVPALQPYT
jgi:hypothetical protein